MKRLIFLIILFFSFNLFAIQTPKNTPNGVGILDSEGRVENCKKLDGQTKDEIIAEVEGSKLYTNGTGSILFKGRVVRIIGNNLIDYADWTTEPNSRAIGIILENVNPLMDVIVKKTGYVSSGIITTNCFVEGIFPNEGQWVYLSSPDGRMTVTPPIVGSGYIQMPIGIWDDGGINLMITFPVGKN